MALIGGRINVIDALRDERKHRSRITMVNTSAVAGVAEYLAFEFPRGTGQTWRVEPLDFMTGAKIAAIELDLLDLQHASEETKRDDRGRYDVKQVRDLHERSIDVTRHAVEVVGPLMIATGKRKRRRRIAQRLFRKNPLAHATPREVSQVVSFLALCLTTSPSRIRKVSGPASSIF